ncbi:16S rRNA (cytidine(1402)-2'-O)-methyltransferase [Candidatus Uhrbacteria bacterium RIFOXYB2_FULL_57_15]|uniref:Ribosomal RNA small subunit methyltransferase I n=1 Tax=Candidatus Uhrbacteria bacterium RIFOXYB2_FULL_57_15 TaxID=1802422 RepID=A0A1F7W925_9BACT|nr:MAG: 16S rRNA (cytidine(1402)-2'-O)-methyltransferase [Candidatus Uhrbacteria bacterium RIFOXYB2_FULL_57_15]
MSTLYVVATPIGNLSDLSARARETLGLVDAILCEDTRVSSKLLAAFGIQKTLVAYHQHSDMKRMKEIVAMLRDGKSLALVTDAGTPAISDPGGILVETVIRESPDTAIIPIPGPSAVIAALSVSGFPCDEFVFLGFPPHKKGRQTFFKRLATMESTVAFYESTHRIEKTLAEIAASVGNRELVVCRELTKLHETTYRGTANEVTELIRSTSIKGEFVIVLGPRS